MKEITIVTAFYDIGRTNWGAFPRSTEEYLERFSWLCELENNMVVFTSPDMVERIAEITDKRKGETIICSYDMLEKHKELNDKIAKVQNNIAFQNSINPSQRHSPEYWCSEYVLVNLLKTVFVNLAIDCGLVDDNFAAWVDFGYCREPSAIGPYPRWEYDFDKDKIHFFSLKKIDERPDIVMDAVFNNNVCTIGTYFVAHQNLWPALQKIMMATIEKYFESNMIDDDQSVMLAAYLGAPHLFEIHQIDPSDWFVLFKQFNEPQK